MALTRRRANILMRRTARLIGIVILAASFGRVLKEEGLA
jgi:hypothetical protein